MKYLTVNEQVLLIAILKLKDNAYPVTIRAEYIKMTKKSIVYGALYNSLEYLRKKGFVISRWGQPTPEKGGKRKVFFFLTEDGMQALQHTREFQQSIWNGVGDAVLGVKKN